MCIAIICYSVCDVIIFETNIDFEIEVLPYQAVFVHNQKVRTKM